MSQNIKEAKEDYIGKPIKIFYPLAERWGDYATRSDTLVREVLECSTKMMYMASNVDPTYVRFVIPQRRPLIFFFRSKTASPADSRVLLTSCMSAPESALVTIPYAYRTTYYRLKKKNK